MADVIDPPETLETRSIFGRMPSSFIRITAPAWNSVARYPPPEKLTPTEVGS